MEHSLHLYCVVYELPPSHWKLWVSHYHNTNIVSHFAINRLSSSLTHQHIFSQRKWWTFHHRAKYTIGTIFSLVSISEIDLRVHFWLYAISAYPCHDVETKERIFDASNVTSELCCALTASLDSHCALVFFIFCSLFNQLSACTSTISIAESLANSSLSDCTKLLISRRIALNRNHWSRMENWMIRRSVSPAIGENLAQSCYLISAAIAAMRTVRDISSPTLSYARIGDVCAYMVACGENWKSECWGFTRMWLKFSWNFDDATRYAFVINSS